MLWPVAEISYPISSKQFHCYAQMNLMQRERWCWSPWVSKALPVTWVNDGCLLTSLHAKCIAVLWESFKHGTKFMWHRWRIQKSVNIFEAELWYIWCGISVLISCVSLVGKWKYMTVADNESLLNSEPNDSAVIRRELMSVFFCVFGRNCCWWKRRCH